MNRRGFFRLLAAVPSLAALWQRLTTPTRAAVTAASSFVCRVRPSDSSWPNAESWEKLKQDVGGQLIEVQSPLAACRATPDSPLCQEIFQHLRNPYYIGDQARATQTTGWLDGWISAPSAFAA